MKKTLLIVGMLAAGQVSAGDYVGVTLGNSKFDIDFPGLEHGMDQEHSGSVGLVAGREWGNKALEVSFTELGDFAIINKDHGTFTSIESLGIAGLYKIHGFFAKGGVEFFEMRTTFNGSPKGKTRAHEGIQWHRQCSYEP